MKLNKISSVFNVNKFAKTNVAIFGATLTAMLAMPTYAEEAPKEDVEVIEVTGIRGALVSAIAEKRDTANLIEVINAEDIGKLPDQNLAEVLENITGVQITRTAGVGSGVQIRGSNDNRVEINGVSTVGSGTGRSGINFEDVSAAIIAGVEVTKASQAKTIEGSVGGTVNLRTIRPLELDDTLGSIRVQGEDSSLTEDGWMPRVSGAYGDKWETNSGTYGFVISGSYTQQEATSFRPRVDRDGSLVENVNADVVRDGTLEDPANRPAALDYDFLGIQFLNQELENFEYETSNISSSFEYAPNDNMKFFADVVFTSQERRQESTRVQGSGVSAVLNQNRPTSFETINYGSLDGQNLGSIAGALTGTIQPGAIDPVTGEAIGTLWDDDDPNLRFNSDTGARLTDTHVFRIGGEWQGENLFVSAEIATSGSDSETPTINSQLNFINPNENTPLDNLDADGNITSSTSNDNSVPFIYDLRGDSLTFGIDFDSPYAPTVDDLLDYNNVVLDQVDISHNKRENSDTAFRIDATYFFDSPVTSVDVGYRYNTTFHESVNVSDRIGGFSKMINSPNGAMFSDLLIAGPSNFGDADGRELALRNYLIVDPEQAFNNRDAVIAQLEQAVIDHNENTGGSYSPIDLTPNQISGFEINEDTHALYAQANFDWEMIRGNLGVRYIQTSVESLGNTEDSDGNITQVTNEGDYDYVLPRLNIVADVHDDVVVRLGWGQDIRRPDYDILNTSVAYGTNENSAVSIGNPELEPEEVTSFDISAEWYFTEAALVSIGYFTKDRSNLFALQLEDATTYLNSDGVEWAEPGPNCTTGIYNPEVQPNVLGDPDTTGLCVDRETTLNDTGTVTQSGIEMSAQYDLSAWEEQIGWASGFGIIANYTIQEFKGGDTVNQSANRGTDIFNAINGIYDDADFVRVEAKQGLLDFSENAYNVAFYYEKHGVSARMRYTWREAFRTDDTAAGASRNSTLGFPVVTHDRGQLNASISYDVTDNFNIGIEGVNLTEEEITQSCVNEGAQLCFQGLTDRRITVGASYNF